MKSSTPQSPKTPGPLAILLIGKGGCGKTTLALQFPEPGVLDLDQNLDGPDRFIRQELKGKLSYVYLTPLLDDKGRPKDDGEIRDAIMEGLEELVDSPKVKTIIIDSITKLSEMLVLWRLKKEGRDVMEISMWQPWRSAIIKLLHKARSSGKHVICSIHEKPVYAPRSGKSIEPAQKIAADISLPTRLADEFPFAFTDVWRAKKVETRESIDYELHCNSDDEAGNSMMSLKNSLGIDHKLSMDWGDLSPFLKGRL